MNKKKFLCFFLSFVIMISAVYAAFHKSKEVNAAFVIDDAMLIAGLLAATGVVLVTGWTTEEERQQAIDKWGEDAVNEVEDDFANYLDSPQHVQDLINRSTWHNLGLDGGDDDNNDDDELSTWEKLKNWVNQHPTETIASTGIGLTAIMLEFANFIKEDVETEPNTDVYLINNVTSYDTFIYNNFSLNYTLYYGGYQRYYNNAVVTGNNQDIYTAVFVYPSTDYDIIQVAFFSKNPFSLKLDTNNSSSGTSTFTSAAVTSQDNPFYTTGFSGDYVSQFSTNSPIFITTGLGGIENQAVMHDILFNGGKEYLKVDLDSQNVKYSSDIQTDDTGSFVALPVSQINFQNFAQNYQENNNALLDAILEEDDTKIQAAVDTIIDSVGTSTTTDPDTGDDTDPDTGDGTLPGDGTGDNTGSGSDVEGETEVDKNLFLLPEEITEKFPFCVPFDIIRAFSVFDSSSRAAPKITLPLKAERYDINYEMEIDLSGFDEIAQLLRNLELILFIIGLAMVSRDLIKG